MTEQVRKKTKPLTRKAQVELTKSTILKAAVELFLESGYGIASLNVLVKRVGCSKETIYKYYGSKQGLFIAVIDCILDDILASVVDLDIQEMELRDGLIHASYKTLERLCTGRYVRLRTLIATSSEDVPEIGKEYYEYIEERSYKAMSKYFQQYIDNGTLKNIDSYRMAKYFWGMMLHDLLFQLYTTVKSKISKRELKAHADQVVDDFLQVYTR